jgi:hypothetical protein
LIGLRYVAHVLFTLLKFFLNTLRDEG